MYSGADQPAVRPLGRDGRHGRLSSSDHRPRPGRAGDPGRRPRRPCCSSRAPFIRIETSGGGGFGDPRCAIRTWPRRTGRTGGSSAGGRATHGRTPRHHRCHAGRRQGRGPAGTRGRGGGGRHDRRRRGRVRGPADREAQVVDAAGATLMPGIIDAHCHLGGASYPDEDRWVLEDDRYQAIASAAQAREMLRHGVTSARDISVNGTRLRDGHRPGADQRPADRPVLARAVARGGHGDARGVPPEMVRTSHPWGLVADGPDEVRARVCGRWSSRAASASRCGPAAAGCTRTSRRTCSTTAWPELRVIVEEAKLRAGAGGRPLRVRVGGRRDAAEAGVWSIEHGEDLDAETIALMADKGISLNPTLVLLTQWLEAVERVRRPLRQALHPRRAGAAGRHRASSGGCSTSACRRT